VGVSGFHTGFHVLTSSGFSEIFRLSSGTLRSLVSVRTSFLVGTQKPETGFSGKLQVFSVVRKSCSRPGLEAEATESCGG